MLVKQEKDLTWCIIIFFFTNFLIFIIKTLISKTVGVFNIERQIKGAGNYG
jgi:hypothetical protein